jgi:hypothetical protein
MSNVELKGQREKRISIGEKEAGSEKQGEGGCELRIAKRWLGEMANVESLDLILFVLKLLPRYPDSQL